MLTPMQISNIVRVVKQPKNIPNILNEIGFIDELRKANNIDYAYIVLLSSRNAGQGYVPCDCLEIDNKLTSKILKQKYDEKMEQIEKEYYKYNENHKQLKQSFVQITMAQTGLSEAQIESVFKCLQEFKNNNYDFNW